MCECQSACMWQPLNSWDLETCYWSIMTNQIWLKLNNIDCPTWSSKGYFIFLLKCRVGVYVVLHIICVTVINGCAMNIYAEVQNDHFLKKKKCMWWFSLLRKGCEGADSGGCKCGSLVSCYECVFMRVCLD